MTYQLEELTKQDIEMLIDATSPPEWLKLTLRRLELSPPHPREAICWAINVAEKSYLLRYTQAPQGGPDQMIFAQDGQLHFLSVESSFKTSKVVHLEARYPNEWTDEELMSSLTAALKLHGTEGSRRFSDHPLLQISNPIYKIRNAP